jgi:AcrR family transcriptional regulator
VKKSQRRDEILRAAKYVFAHHGFHTAGIDHIIKRAGIARGTFYLYFTGKRHIFDTLLDDFLKELDRRIRPIDVGRGQAPPLDQLRDNLRRVLDLVARDPETMQIILRQATGLDRQSRGAILRFYDHLRNMIERSLGHGVRMGLIRHCDVRIVSACVLGSIKEVVDDLASRPVRSHDPVIDEIIRFGLYGLLRK